MNKKDVCATQIAYVRFTEDDLADLDKEPQAAMANRSTKYFIESPFPQSKLPFLLLT